MTSPEGTGGQVTEYKDTGKRVMVGFSDKLEDWTLDLEKIPTHAFTAPAKGAMFRIQEIPELRCGKTIYIFSLIDI